MRLYTSLAALAAIAIVSCSSDDGPPTDPDPDARIPVTLDVGEAIPLDRVPVTLPDEFGEATYVEVRAAGTTVVAFAPVIERDGDTFFIAPIHLIDPINGGTVTLTFVDGETLSTDNSFTLSPLPPADGTFQSVFNALRQLVDEWARVGDTTVAGLLATDPSILTSAEIGIVLAGDLTHNVNHANSLMGILDGTAPMLNGETLDLDLLDRLTARTGLQTHLEAVRDDVAQLPVRARLSGVDRRIGLCIPIGQDEPGLLASLMTEACAARSFIDGARGDVVEDLGPHFATIGAITPLPGAAPVGKAISGVLSAYSTVMDGVANTFPSSFGPLTFNAGPTEFQEDDASLGEWDMVIVIARSNGWSVTKLVLQRILSALKVGDSVQGFVAESELASEIADFATSTVTDAVIGAADDSTIQFAPCTWSVDITPAPYSEAQVVSGDAIETIGTSQNYKAVRAGQSVLQVQTASGQFGCSAAQATVPITVKAIQIQVMPPQQEVEPGEVIDFTYTIENAINTEVEITPDFGSLVSQSEGEFTVETSTNEDDYSYRVTVESTSESGPRGEPGAPDRFGTATIALDPPLEIVPSDICIPVGESETFRLIGSDGMEVDATWTVDPPSAGSFSNNQFNATTDTGDVLIIATTTEIPAQVVQAAAQVQRCACTWSATVSSPFTGAAGDHIEWSDITGVQTNFVFSLSPDPTSIFPFGTILFEGSLPEGQTGTFPVAIGYVESEELGVGTGEELSGTMNITRHVNGAVQGTVFATMIYEPPFPQDPIVVFFDMTFYARKSVPVVDPTPCRDDDP